MNNKQKQKRALLAIGLAVLLVLIVGISAMISCGTSKCAGSQPTNTQSKSDVIVSESERVASSLARLSPA